MMSRKLLLLITLFMGPMGACEDPGEDPVLQCPNKTITGKDGDTVILPCSTKTNLSLEEVEWSFMDPTTGEYETVHTYLQCEDYLVEQSDEFKNRTSLFKKKLSLGNGSLSLKVKANHSGTYRCCVPGHHCCTVTLKVHPKGKNIPSQNHQEDNPSPDNPKNGTDRLKNTGLLVLLALLFLASSL